MKPKKTFPTIIFFFVLTVIGFALVSSLSLQWLPSTSAPSIILNYTWPDASPQLLEREVTSPLEAAMNLINGIKKVSSVSTLGNGYITLEFDKNVQLDYLRFEVAAKVRQLYPKLPQTLAYPQIQLNAPDEPEKESPVLTYSLSGKELSSELFSYAQEVLKAKLASIKGLQKLEVAGANQEEWRIVYNKEILDKLSLQPRHLQEAIHGYFDTKALGMVQDGNHSFYISLNNWKSKPNGSSTDFSKYLTINALRQIPIANIKNRLVYLKDVAQLSLTEQALTSFYRVNGQNSIRLLFFPEKGINNIELTKAIKERLQQLQSTLPQNYTLFLEEDATEYLNAELKKIKYRSLLSSAILLLFVLITYRNFIYLWIIALALTANLGSAFILYYIFSVELHLYALAGITVSLGIIIDNTIIIVHHIRNQGNLKVFPALLAATLTTSAALLIIFFLPELWKNNLLDFAKVVLINLAVSLLVALWLIPALMEQFFRKQKTKQTRPQHHCKRKKRVLHFNHAYEKILNALFYFRKTLILLVVLSFGLPVFHLPDKVDNWNWYNHSLGNEWYINKLRPFVNKALGGTLRLFVRYVYEGAAYQEPLETVLTIQASMPQGTTLQQMNQLYCQLEAYLAQFPKQVKSFITTINSNQFGQTKVHFNQAYEISFPHLLRTKLIQYASNLGGVEWNIYGVGKGFNNLSRGMGANYRLLLYGYNKVELKKQANIFAAKLSRHPRVKEVNTEANVNWWLKERYEYEMTLDKRSLKERKINPQFLAPLFKSFNQSTNPDLYNPGGTAISLIDKSLANNDLWLFQNQYLKVDSTRLKMASIGTLKKKKAATAIHKENQQYLRMLEWEYAGSPKFGNKLLDKVSREMRQQMPIGYSFEQVNNSFRDKEQKKQYGLILLLIVLIYYICACMFESLRQALSIVLLIPISFIGIFLSFYIFDINFDQGAYASFILLSGLVVNSLILILNDYNGFVKRFPNRSKKKLYIKAFNHKITPIFLTILSTSLGFLPFLIYGQQDVFWYTLAVGTIGGLLFSPLVLFFFVPLFLLGPNKQLHNDKDQ